MAADTSHVAPTMMQNAAPSRFSNAPASSGSFAPGQSVNNSSSVPSHSQRGSISGSIIDSLPAPEMFIRGLTDRAMFTPLPQMDPLASLLIKQFPAETRPARANTSFWHERTVEDMADKHHWRALALYAQDAILRSKAEATGHILSLWALRFYALQRMRVPTILFQEVQALFRLLPVPYTSPVPPRGQSMEPFFHPSIPFDLLVFRARVPALHSRQDVALETLFELLEGCKRELWAGGGGSEVWRQRANAISRMIASTLLSMHEYAHAASVLQGIDDCAPSTVALVHLSSGNLAAAKDVMAEDRSPTVNLAEMILKGDFEGAEAAARAALEASKGKDGTTANTLAVILLYRSKLAEAASVLTQLIATQPLACFQSEPIISNLSTLVELLPQPPEGVTKWTKHSLLAAAGQHTGDGISISAFKL